MTNVLTSTDVGIDRYQQFVQRTAQLGSAWGLFRDGWALDRDEAGASVFLFWSSERGAKACAKGPWAGFEAAPIPLDDLVDMLLPQLARDGVQAGLDRPANGAALIAPIAALLGDLEQARGEGDEADE